MPRPPFHPVRWQPPPVDPLPAPQTKPITVVPVGGLGPEDVVIDDDGYPWTGLVDGRILRLTPDGAEQKVVADTGGRPLGLHVARDGRVLICDSPRGLLALDPRSGALDVLATEVDGRPLRFCSNVTETADGTIYFTESTSEFEFDHFVGALLEGRGGGGLYRLDPDGRVSTLVDGLYFANGLTVTADGSALVFAETVGRRLSKYWLTGPAAGTVTPLAEHLPGMPDNISTGADGRIWTSLATPVNSVVESLFPRAPWVRRVIWRLPSRLRPQPQSIVWVAAFDPDDGSAVAGIRTEHPDFGVVTGVVEAPGRLWLSTYRFSALAYCDL